MEPIDRIDPGMKPSVPIPLTDEMNIQQKKLRRQTELDDTKAALESPDVFTPSEATTKADKYEQFIRLALDKIPLLDRTSEDFVPNATREVVAQVLKMEYGDRMVEDPGYSQMEKKLTKKMLDDPKYREMMEDFLKFVSLSE